MTTTVTETDTDSEIGPTDASPRRRRRALVLVLVGFLAVVLVAEASARVLSTKLLDPQWQSRISLHLENMDELDAVPAGTETVLVLGSSSAGAGVDPRQLADDSETVGGAYDFWLAGTSVQALAELYPAAIEDVYDAGVVVLALTSRELNDVGVPQAEGFESIMSSPGMKEANGTQSWLGRVDSSVSEWSDLVAYRSTLTDPARLQEELRRSGGLATISGRGMLTEHVGRSEPLLTERHLDQEREALDPFAVGGPETAALEEFVTSLTNSGVEVLIVSLPVLPEFAELHPDGEADVVAAREAMGEVADLTGVQFLDAAGEAWGRDQFGDENHLNGAGSTRLTALIAATLDARARSTPQ